MLVAIIGISSTVHRYEGTGSERQRKGNKHEMKEEGEKEGGKTQCVRNRKGTNAHGTRRKGTGREREGTGKGMKNERKGNNSNRKENVRRERDKKQRTGKRKTTENERNKS